MTITIASVIIVILAVSLASTIDKLQKLQAKCAEGYGELNLWKNRALKAEKRLQYYDNVKPAQPDKFPSHVPKNREA